MFYCCKIVWHWRLRLFIHELPLININGIKITEIAGENVRFCHLNCSWTIRFMENPTFCFSCSYSSQKNIKETKILEISVAYCRLTSFSPMSQFWATRKWDRENRKLLWILKKMQACNAFQSQINNIDCYFPVCMQNFQWGFFLLFEIFFLQTLEPSLPGSLSLSSSDASCHSVILFIICLISIYTPGWKGVWPGLFAYVCYLYLIDKGHTEKALQT